MPDLQHQVLIQTHLLRPMIDYELCCQTNAFLLKQLVSLLRVSCSFYSHLGAPKNVFSSTMKINFMGCCWAQWVEWVPHTQKFHFMSQSGPPDEELIGQLVTKLHCTLMVTVVWWPPTSGMSKRLWINKLWISWIFTPYSHLLFDQYILFYNITWFNMRGFWKSKASEMTKEMSVTDFLIHNCWGNVTAMINQWRVKF